MSIVDGIWKTDHDTGDETSYPNHRDVGELKSLVEHRTFDIVVVGGGGAGATAAIEASELGASVLILEKMSSPGGSTQESGGTVRLVSDSFGTTEHFFALAQGATPHEVIEAFVTGLAELPDWVRAHGGELIERTEEEFNRAYTRWVFPAIRSGTAFPNLPYASSLAPRAWMRPSRPDRFQGAALWDFLSRNLAELDVPMVLGARVVKLVQQFPERAVIGVEVQVGDERVIVQARKGVILCCGGFAYDPELMTQYFGLRLPALSPPNRATGDGIRMAQDVGADLWHMGGSAMSVGYAPAELKAGFHCRMPSYGFVMVDQLGRRYVCETDLENHSAPLAMMTQDLLSGEYLRVPSFVILDDETRRAGELTMNERGQNRHYPWSSDNSVEIEKGWIEEAETLGDLSVKLNVPADTLEEEIDEFNRCCDLGLEDRFGRESSQMRRIIHPPFYGCVVRPTLLNTQGGPRRDARGQILRPDGSAIPGLYGAGELGSIWNRLYPGAGNVSECLVSGRLAARTALSAPAEPVAP